MSGAPPKSGVGSISSAVKLDHLFHRVHDGAHQSAAACGRCNLYNDDASPFAVARGRELEFGSQVKNGDDRCPSDL